MAKVLIEARKVKNYQDIFETSVEKQPLYSPGECCIFMLIKNEDCILLRVGIRTNFIK